MNRLIVLSFFIGACIDLYGQKSPVVVNYQFNPDFTADFFYEKPVPGSFLINLSFSKTENTDVTDISEVVKGMNGKFYTLIPVIREQPVRFSLKYSAFRGNPGVKVDTNFVYLLPVSKGKTIRVGKDVSYLNYNFFVEKGQKWEYLLFHASPGDTVFSVRKGLVVEVMDGMEAKESESFPFKDNKLNSVTIEHDDGTLACYSLLKKNSIRVKPGDQVLPYTPLAMAQSAGVNDFFLFCLTCLKKENPGNKGSTFTGACSYSVLNPLFRTDSGKSRLQPGTTVTSDFSEEDVTKELSKKELKKLGK